MFDKLMEFFGIDKLMEFFGKLDSDKDRLFPNIARFLGWLCIAFAIVFAIITYKQFMSM